MPERAAPPRTHAAAAALALAAFAAFRLPALVRYPPWTDEMFTIAVTQRPFRTMVAYLADDQTNPPLFYLLLWVWRAVGGASLWWLRLMPSLCGVLMALPVLAICRRARLGAPATALALAATAASQALVFHSNELRAYALYALLAACSIALWLRAREERAPRDLSWLTAVNVALVYSHYFGTLVVAVEFLDALLWSRARLRGMALSAAATALSLVPWIAMVARRAHLAAETLGNASWIPAPIPGDLFDPYRWALGRGPSIAVDLALLVAIGGLVAWHVVRRRREHPALLPLAAFAIVPSLVALAVSLAAPRSVWVSRYLLATAAPFLVIAAAACVDALPAALRRFGAALALWPAFVTVTALAEGREKVRFDRLANGIDASRVAAPEAFAMSWVEGGPLRYQGLRLGGAPRVTALPSVDSLTAGEGWLVWSENHPPHGLPPAAGLRRHGYTVGAPLVETGMWDDQLARADSVIAMPFHRARP